MNKLSPNQIKKIGNIAVKDVVVLSLPSSQQDNTIELHKVLNNDYIVYTQDRLATNEVKSS